MKEFLPFIDPRLRIGWDERVGHGVFSSEPIKKGEFIEIAPVVVVEKAPEDENLFKYLVEWGGKLAVPLGWTMLYNHSDESHCEYSINIQDGLFAIVATRDIPAESQITVNYGPNWFSSRGMEKVQL